MPEFKQKLTKILTEAYRNFYVKINKDGNLYDISVIGPFGELVYQDRISDIYEILDAKLSDEEKFYIGYVNAYTSEEYASTFQNEEQAANPLIRWVDLPEVFGFVLCGAYNSAPHKVCRSSFVIFSRDYRTGREYPVCENYVYEGLAYDFIIKDGNDIYKYAMDHVYNLAPSFFLSPYMELYMRASDFSRYNPYGFAFRALPFSIAEPSVDRMRAFIEIDKLEQLKRQTTIESIRQNLNRLIEKIGTF